MSSNDDFEQRQEALRRKAEMDQATSFITDTLPVMWRGMFDKLQSQGFTEEQALDLVKTYIISQGGGDKKAP